MNTQVHPRYTPKGPKASACPDIQALVHDINIAHKKGALFFLAVQLERSLEEHFEKSGPPTAVELETLIAQVAKTMMSCR
jgi:hypothetical protein